MSSPASGSPRINPPAVDSLVAALLEPTAYGHPVAAVTLIETHISWIFLTGALAYKVKKPVNLGFVDFSSPERRRHCCQEELRLNRRLAPELYLGLCAVRGPRSQARLHGPGPEIDTAVVMRQFDQRDLLPEILARGALAPQRIDALAVDLARFHAAAAVAAADTPWGLPERVLEPALVNLEVLQNLERLPDEAGWLRQRTIRDWERLRPRFAQRRSGGHIRECHGDLHLGNLVLLEGRIRVFDCLEFSPALRWIDPISDLAFLVMDLRERDQPRLALRLLNAWLESGGDHAGLRLLPWYLAYRALVRAKVTALRLQQEAPTHPEAAGLVLRLGRYVDQACRSLEPGRGALVITHGVSGSGKSHAAMRLRQQGWIHLRSDVERLRLRGLWGVSPAEVEPGLRATAAADPYAPAVSRWLYGTALLQAAESALAAGLAVVVDATFLRRDQRRLFQELARRCGAGFGLLACEVGLEEALAGVERRRGGGGDPSEADAAVVRHQFSRLQALEVAERPWLVRVDQLLARSPGEGLAVPSAAAF